MTSYARVVSLAAAAEAVAEARASGKRVALANGCFDLLHVGHLRYLEGARALAGFLVVGVNSDASVARLKGAGRPLLGQEGRSLLVAALEAVDRVVVFEEPDVTALLVALRPDLHAKGTDYTVDTVPEREVARGLGAEVAITGDAKTHSTRTLLERLRSTGHERSK